MLGGPDVIVEIDEGMFGKRRYNRGNIPSFFGRTLLNAERYVAVKRRQDCGVHHRPPHTNTIVVTAQIESRFVTEEDLVLFLFSPISSFDTTPNGGVSEWVSLAADVMGAAIPDVFSQAPCGSSGRHRGS
ncbi:hypothetical protein TNCV_3869841 [Trichonephila clavipes]|nr:hypothetical protein TNCV_3869841 [Trichonephila clavipes]